MLELKPIELTFDNVNLETLETLFSGGGVVFDPWPKLSDEQVADILEKAADLYQSEQVEWCANDWIRISAEEKVSVCAGGALALAAGVNMELFHKAYGDQYSNGSLLANDPRNREFMQVLNRTAGYLGRPVPSWNDDPRDRNSKQNVIDRFRMIAKDIRNNIEGESSK